jgi:hypothetical protein
MSEGWARRVIGMLHMSTCATRCPADRIAALAAGNEPDPSIWVQI